MKNLSKRKNNTLSFKDSYLFPIDTTRQNKHSLSIEPWPPLEEIGRRSFSGVWERVFGQRIVILNLFSFRIQCTRVLRTNKT